jgi:hypothetical protein
MKNKTNEVSRQSRSSKTSFENNLNLFVPRIRIISLVERATQFTSFTELYDVACSTHTLTTPMHIKSAYTFRCHQLWLVG